MKNNLLKSLIILCLLNISALLPKDIRLIFTSMLNMSIIQCQKSDVLSAINQIV